MTVAVRFKRTAGDVTEHRLKDRSSGLNARFRLRSASFDDKYPSNPCILAFQNYT